MVHLLRNSCGGSLEDKKCRSYCRIVYRAFLAVQNPSSLKNYLFLFIKIGYNFYFPFFFFFLLFWGTRATHGSSQARGQIGAVAPAHATATAMPDPSRVCNLQHRSQQHRILNPLSEARDQTLILMDPSQVY